MVYSYVKINYMEGNKMEQLSLDIDGINSTILTDRQTDRARIMA